MNGAKLTKIAKKCEQISHFIDPSSLTDRVGFHFGNISPNLQYVLTQYY